MTLIMCWFCHGTTPVSYHCKDFQSVIGREIKKQIMEKEGKLPDVVMACVAEAAMQSERFMSLLVIQVFGL